VDLLRRLKELKVGIPVIVITGHGDVQLAVEAMKIGAVDFIEKPFDDDLLLAAIRSALGRWEKDSQQESGRAKLLDKIATLSSREREVLDGLVAGKPNKVIAFDLGISPRTVEIYRANVMTKTGAGSLSELVRMAMVAGLAEPAADE
jgi:two-component system, LuxR family, response regulator FixJ